MTFNPRIIQTGLFLLLTAFSMGQSWRHLKNRHDYRFYRFFAYEGVLALFLFNLQALGSAAPRWQEALFWCGVLSALVLLFLAYAQLRRAAGASGSIETTQRFTAQGIYRWIRHPFYSGFAFFCLGIFFKAMTLLNGVLLLLITACIYLTARYEERENLARFGEAYRQYIDRTKMFLPFLLLIY